MPNPDERIEKAKCKCLPKPGFYGGFRVEGNEIICNVCRLPRTGKAHGKIMSEGEKLQLNEVMAPIAAPLYSIYYARLALVARENGYCLSIHGSMARDLDLVATPWTEEAISAEALIEKFKADILLKDMDSKDEDGKPHGRKSFNLSADGGLYIDVSIMPVLKSPMPPSTTAGKRPGIRWKLNYEPKWRDGLDYWLVREDTPRGLYVICESLANTDQSGEDMQAIVHAHNDSLQSPPAPDEAVRVAVTEIIEALEKIGAVRFGHQSILEEHLEPEQENEKLYEYYSAVCFSMQSEANKALALLKSPTPTDGVKLEEKGDA